MVDFLFRASVHFTQEGWKVIFGITTLKLCLFKYKTFIQSFGINAKYRVPTIFRAKTLKHVLVNLLLVSWHVQVFDCEFSQKESLKRVFSERFRETKKNKQTGLFR